ncbi:hypothetical protein [Aliikangiella sp. IMCC44359]|uniref:hypothetical protein n=1 Tax=Aliikangiella sp. IMCC44359 TaxID=3459125 RepID=UPI00403B1694
MFKKTSIPTLVLIILAICFLAISLLSVYLNQHLEGFGALNRVYAIPFLYQVILLLVFVLLSAFFVFKQKSRLLSLGIIAGFICVFISSYSLTFSSNINAISTDIGPITINQISFSDNLTIERKWYGFLVVDQKTNESIQLLNRITPLVIYGEQVEQYISGLGECLESKNKQCVKYSVAWP